MKISVVHIQTKRKQLENVDKSFALSDHEGLEKEIKRIDEYIHYLENISKE